MIEKMKKLTLVIHHSAKDEFLDKLQKLGVAHLEVNKAVLNDDIKISNELITRFKKNYLFLASIKKESKIKYAQKDFKSGLDNILSEIEERNEKINKLKSELENFRKDIELLSPWGAFDPELINKLSENNIHLKFYSAASKIFEEIDKEAFNIEVIQKIHDKIYFILICRNNEKPGFDANEERIPNKNIKELQREIDALEKEIKKEQKELETYLCYEDYLNKEIVLKTNQLEYFIARASMIEEAEGAILIIQGWIPKKVLTSVENFLAKEEVVNIVDEPEEGDNIPILLKNNFFARLFEPITKMHSMPKYTEIDPTPFFAPFFALFFGLCLADVGYGLVFLSVIILALIFVRNKKMRGFIWLGFIFSLTTIAGGFILDTFFGTKVTELSFLSPGIKKGVIYSDMYQAMGFSLIIGIIQVFLGFFLQAVNRVKKYGFFGLFQPIGTIIFVSGLIVVVMPMLSDILGSKLSELNAGPIKFGYWISLIPDVKIGGFNFYALLLLFTGLAMILFFNSLESKIFIRPLKGLWEVYGIITGVPGDILSYIRLFALGLAGGLLGNAFNKIAFMLKDAIPILPLAYLGMLLIMLVGHGLNLALAALSAFVHPLRLVLLEFYKSVGFEGGSIEYSPFKIK